MLAPSSSYARPQLSSASLRQCHQTSGILALRSSFQVHSRRALLAASWQLQNPPTLKAGHKTWVEIVRQIVSFLTLLLAYTIPIGPKHFLGAASPFVPGVAVRWLRCVCFFVVEVLLLPDKVP